MSLFSPLVRKTCGIRKVSLDTFYVFHWTDDQLTFWKKICNLNLPISLDATGDLVRKKITPNLKCNRTILYYALVVGIDGKIVSLMQFVTSIHHVAVIEEALNTWIEKTQAPSPKNISTDGSTALQHAVCKSFNKMSFSEYNLQCYIFLINESKLLPPCYYKSDLAHLLRTLNFWQCFTSKATKTQLIFYKRCIAFLSQRDSLTDFRKIAVALFTVSITETYVVGSQCFEDLIFLSMSDGIKTYEIPEEDSPVLDNIKSRVIMDVDTENSK